MSVIRIDVDDEALAEVMRVMAASSENDVVNAVLREYVYHANRLEDEERLAAMWAGFPRPF